MKNLAIAFILMLLIPVSLMASKKTCTCGSHASGITTFYVDEGQPCCKGTYSGADEEAAEFRTYALGLDGVWYQTSISFPNNSTAQIDCCGG